jgi:hypothetical protein
VAYEVDILCVAGNTQFDVSEKYVTKVARRFQPALRIQGTIEGTSQLWTRLLCGSIQHPELWSLLLTALVKIIVNHLMAISEDIGSYYFYILVDPEGFPKEGITRLASFVQRCAPPCYSAIEAYHVMGTIIDQLWFDGCVARGIIASKFNPLTLLFNKSPSASKEELIGTGCQTQGVESNRCLVEIIIRVGVGGELLRHAFKLRGHNGIFEGALSEKRATIVGPYINVRMRWSTVTTYVEASRGEPALGKLNRNPGRIGIKSVPKDSSVVTRT